MKKQKRTKPVNVEHVCDKIFIHTIGNRNYDFTRPRALSQEKRAEVANRRTKENKETTIHPTDTALSGLRREYLQKLVETRCSVITQHYYEEGRKLREAFNKASVNTSTSQYHRVGSAPHEIEFLDQSSSLMRSYLDELRELRGICNSFGLRANPLLDRVFGCNVQ